MKKGQILESRFSGWIKGYNSLTQGLAIRIEVKYNVKKCIYVEKQPADYVVISPSMGLLLLDSKEVSKDKFYPNAQPAHQIESMKRMQALGYIAGFVVWFRESDPIGVNLRLITNFDRPSTIKDGEMWTFLLDDYKPYYVKTSGSGLNFDSDIVHSVFTQNNKGNCKEAIVSDLGENENGSELEKDVRDRRKARQRQPRFNFGSKKRANSKCKSDVNFDNDANSNDDERV